MRSVPRMRHLLIMGVCTAAISAGSTSAFAQSTGNVIEELVVTAEKREQSLQDVPVAISAYTAETRQLLGLQNVQDYTAFTPGLSYSGSNDRVFVRGIGRQTNTNGSDPGVATYTDGVYDAQTFTVGASDFFLDRVEILRGPQGTLYGRNSIGGAINAISKRPTEEFAAEARVIDGRHREHHRLDLGEQRLGRCEVTAAELGGHRLADLPPPVVDPRQPDAGQRGEDPGMVPPERTAPDHADRERLHSPASSSRPERPGRTRQTPRRLARIQSIR